MRDLEKELLGKGYCHIAGIDEAGRGPLAGPVVAAAVILPSGSELTDVKDSKQLSVKRRVRVYQEIMEIGTVGIGVASSAEIDQVNILQATFLAMRRAVAELSGQVKVDYCIVSATSPFQTWKLPNRRLSKQTPAVTWWRRRALSPRSTETS